MGTVPQVINRFNIYQSGKKLIGISGEITLPSVTNLTDSLEGSGVGGTVDLPVIGLVDSLEMEIPFMSLTRDIFTMMDPTESQDLTLNGSIQGMDSGSGKPGFVPLSIAVRGICKEFTPGNTKAGAKMESSIKLELIYYKIILDGKTMLEIDKLNSVYVVNGHDILEKVRNMC